jgi:hypothetical protein
VEGSHRVTLPVEVNADGVPPTEVELIGPDERCGCKYELGPAAAAR